MIYYFFGLDQWAIKKALEKLVADSSNGPKEILRFDGIDLESQVLEQEMINISFFSVNRLLIISNLSKNRKTTEVDQIITLLDKNHDHLELVFTEEGSPDKRTALHKKLVKNASYKEFTSPNSTQLVNQIKELVKTKQSSISNQAAIALAAMIPTDSLRLEQELCKLSLLRLNSEISEEDVSDLVIAENNSNIFNFIESLANQNFSRTYQSLDKLITAGQNENYILTMITWQFRQLLIVRSLLDQGKATAATAGINPYVFGKILSLARKYSMQRLKTVYQLVEQAEFSIKTGELEGRPALELVAANILSC